MGEEDYSLYPDHSAWSDKRVKHMCDCGKMIFPDNYINHEKSNRHSKYLILCEKIEDDVKTIQIISKSRMELYLNAEKGVNCCCKCFNSYISNDQFNKKFKICKCCEEILIGGVKNCSICKLSFEIKDLERPYLFRCRPCATKLKKDRALAKKELSS